MRWGAALGAVAGQEVKGWKVNGMDWTCFQRVDQAACEVQVIWAKSR